MSELSQQTSESHLLTTDPMDDQSALLLGKTYVSLRLAAGSPSQLYHFARRMALCIPASAEPKRASLANECLAILRQAITEGFRDVELLKTQKDFKPIRGRSDFQKLLAEMERKR